MVTEREMYKATLATLEDLKKSSPEFNEAAQQAIACLYRSARCREAGTVELARFNLELAKTWTNIANTDRFLRSL